MEKKIAGLLGAVATLGALSGAQAAPAPAPTPTDVMRANSYADLLQPIPNAAALLQAIDESAPAQPADQNIRLAQGIVIGVGHHHHHHHHHHGYRPRVIIVPPHRHHTITIITTTITIITTDRRGDRNRRACDGEKQDLTVLFFCAVAERSVRSCFRAYSCRAFSLAARCRCR